MIRVVLILLVAAALIVGAWAVHPGLGILVALLSYAAVEGLRHKPRKLTPDQQAELDRKKLGY